MGCSAAKNLAVEPMNENGTAVPVSETRKASIKSASDEPALESEEPEAETLEINNVQESTNGLAFDIGFEEEGGESIIRKHPPKRFQRLEEQQTETSPNLSLARLQEKLDEAEARRQQILQQRAVSAKVRTGPRRQNNVTSSEEGAEGEEGADDGADGKEATKEGEEETKEEPEGHKEPPDIAQ